MVRAEFAAFHEYSYLTSASAVIPPSRKIKKGVASKGGGQHNAGYLAQVLGRIAKWAIIAVFRLSNKFDPPRK